MAKDAETVKLRPPPADETVKRRPSPPPPSDETSKRAPAFRKGGMVKKKGKR